jgi:hypothetical protein
LFLSNRDAEDWSLKILPDPPGNVRNRHGFQFRVEVSCHFDGKSMAQSFPILGKSFSFAVGNRTSKVVRIRGYPARKALSTPVQEFGTSIATGET